MRVVRGRAIDTRDLPSQISQIAKSTAGANTVFVERKKLDIPSCKPERSQANHTHCFVVDFTVALFTIFTLHFLENATR